jgi:outer membrane protein
MMVRIACVALATIVASTVAGAQNFKIGVVSTDVIIKELPEAIKASKTMEELGLKYRDTLQMMQKEFETRVENYRKQEAMMTAEGKRKESLAGLRQRFMMYNEEKNAEIKKMSEEFMQPIRQKVSDAIAAVAKEEKLNMVLEKSLGVVLYSEDKADVTYKVLDRMKRGGN